MLSFNSDLLPARQLLAKYVAWVVDQYVNKREAAKFLGLSRTTLDRLLKETDHYAQPKPRQSKCDNHE
jgi:hypothetical protein